MTRAAAGLLAALALAVGCRERSSAPAERAAPPSTPAPAAPSLRPLTSRDLSPEPEPGPAQGLPPGHPPIPAGQTGSVSGTIAPAAALAARIGPADTLFIIARSSATRQILAVRKEQKPRFPFRFSVSGSDAMVEGSAFEGPVDVTARVSKSGDALPAGGDLEGTAKGIDVGTTEVRIVLDSVRQ